jgi:hypothetical protein
MFVASGLRFFLSASAPAVIELRRSCGIETTHIVVRYRK